MKTIANEFWVPDSNLGRTAHPWLLTSILSQSNITRPFSIKAAVASPAPELCNRQEQLGISILVSRFDSGIIGPQFALTEEDLYDFCS